MSKKNNFLAHEYIEVTSERWSERLIIDELKLINIFVGDTISGMIDIFKETKRIGEIGDTVHGINFIGMKENSVNNDKCNSFVRKIDTNIIESGVGKYGKLYGLFMIGNYEKSLQLEEVSPELNNYIQEINYMYRNENGSMSVYGFGCDMYYKHIEIIVNEIFSIAKDLNIQLFLYVNSIEILNKISEVSRNLNLDDRFRLLRLEVRDNGIPYTIDYTLDILESSIESGWEFR